MLWPTALAALAVATLLYLAVLIWIAVNGFDLRFRPNPVSAAFAAVLGLPLALAFGIWSPIDFFGSASPLMADRLLTVALMTTSGAFATLVLDRAVRAAERLGAVALAPGTSSLEHRYAGSWTVVATSATLIAAGSVAIAAAGSASSLSMILSSVARYVALLLFCNLVGDLAVQASHIGRPRPAPRKEL